MNPDDTVVYTADHHEWLLKAGLWPSSHIRRTDYVGRIVALEPNGLVRVMWAHGRELVHLPENLEVA